MGKTKTAFVGGAESDSAVSGEEKYKKRQAQKAKEQALQKKEEAKKKKAKVDEKGKAQIAKVGLKGGERIKTVGGDEVITESTEESTEDTDKVTKRKPRVRGKKYQAAKTKINRDKTYTPSDAVKLTKAVVYSNFDETFELHLVVKDKKINVNVELPYSFGKAKKIEVADEKTIENLKKNTINFDVLLATKEMMPKMVPFAKLLGPKGLMPNPKNGTLIKTPADAKKFSGNTLNIKTEKDAPLIHLTVGKTSQKDEELTKNIEAIFSAIDPKRIVKAYLKSTMSPSVKLKL